MLISINTATFGKGDIYSAISRIQQLGFVGIELSPENLCASTSKLSDSDMKKLQNVCKKFKYVTLHGPYSSLLTKDDNLRQRSLEEVELWIELAVRLNAPLVTIHSGNPESTTSIAETKAIAASSLLHLDNFASDRGIEIGLETADYTREILIIVPGNKFLLLILI